MHIPTNAPSLSAARALLAAAHHCNEWPGPADAVTLHTADLDRDQLEVVAVLTALLTSVHQATDALERIAGETRRRGDDSIPRQPGHPTGLPARIGYGLEDRFGQTCTALSQVSGPKGDNPKRELRLRFMLSMCCIQSTWPMCWPPCFPVPPAVTRSSCSTPPSSAAEVVAQPRRSSWPGCKLWPSARRAPRCTIAASGSTVLNPTSVRSASSPACCPLAECLVRSAVPGRRVRISTDGPSATRRGGASRERTSWRQKVAIGQWQRHLEPRSARIPGKTAHNQAF